MLTISEIYPAILGESRFAGLPGTIVRLAGCPVQCQYCDTGYASGEGEFLERDRIVATVTGHRLRAVLVTGGEPLVQPECIELLRDLLAVCDPVILETSGTTGLVPLNEIPAGVKRIVDIKTPGSGVTDDRIDWPGLATLGPEDEIKIVCCDRDDYRWARDLVTAGDRLPPRTPVSIGAVADRLAPRELAEWILADRLPVRFQLQLHKVLWPEVDRGV